MAGENSNWPCVSVQLPTLIHDGKLDTKFQVHMMKIPHVRGPLKLAVPSDLDFVSARG